MSSAKACRSDSSAIAEPPNLTTMVLPEKCVSQGKRLDEDAGLGPRLLQPTRQHAAERVRVERELAGRSGCVGGGVGGGHHVEYAEFSCT